MCVGDHLLQIHHDILDGHGHGSGWSCRSDTDVKAEQFRFPSIVHSSTKRYCVLRNRLIMIVWPEIVARASCSLQCFRFPLDTR